MRDYGRIYTAFWTSPGVQAFSDDGKLLAVYLLTSPHTTIAGAFRLPDAYVCDDLGWPPARVKKGFAELFLKGFCDRCETSKWVWIRKFLLWNRPENPNQWKAVARIADQIPPRASFFPEFSVVFVALRDGQPFPEMEPSRNGSETLSKSGSGSGSGTGTGTGEISPGPATDPKPDPIADTIARLKAIYPKRSGSQRWPDAEKALRARLKEGFTPQQILDGATRYAGYIEACGKAGTGYVQQIATFLGTAKGFTEEWSAPASSQPARRLTRFEQAMAQLDLGNETSEAAA